MTERISPFHCPYCAEENLWPREPEGWECRSCLRAFSVTFLGHLQPGGSTLRQAQDTAGPAGGEVRA